MNERPSRWSPAATRADGSPGELANATCALCGIELSIISLVPDGGPGSAEVRWYCRDIVSCTERWTASRPWADQGPVPGGSVQYPGVEPVRGEQAAPPADPAVVAADAPAQAGEPGPADDSGSADEPGPAEEPEPDKVRAGQSSGRGHKDVG